MSRHAPLVYWRAPTARHLAAFLASAAASSLSYDAAGATASDTTVPGFANDQARIRVGHGESAFNSACTALRRWIMFPAPWTRIHPADAPIVTGTTVVAVLDLLGVTWLAASRIVYTINEANKALIDHATIEPAPVRRFGFAYGTLALHAECGEERFLVEMLADGSVWYDIRSFSRPRHWLARLGSPLVRDFQRRFREQSCDAMQREVARMAT